MTQTYVINVRDGEAVRDAGGTSSYIYIGRPSKWGNPFTHKDFRRGDSYAQFKVATREEAISKYADWLLTQPHLIAALPELRGCVLGCFCKPLACHGDVLARMANAL